MSFNPNPASHPISGIIAWKPPKKIAYAFIANYVGVYILAVVILPALHLVVLLEERELRHRFGEEYDLYRARVPRYIPRAAG